MAVRDRRYSAGLMALFLALGEADYHGVYRGILRSERREEEDLLFDSTRQIFLHHTTITSKLPWCRTRIVVTNSTNIAGRGGGPSVSYVGRAIQFTSSYLWPTRTLKSDDVFDDAQSTLTFLQSERVLRLG